MKLIYFVALASSIGLAAEVKAATLNASCAAPDSTTGISTFLIKASSPVGEINNILIKFDSKRKLAVSSTALHDQMNSWKNFTRSAEPFGPLDCPLLAMPTYQQNCTGGFSMTAAQKVTADPRYTWDRGHLTPVNPMRFSEDAMNKTFSCVNIAPQDSWTNQIPWMTIEVKTEIKLRDTNGYVMTGLCSANNSVNGATTYKGYIIPKCFWKLACYKDKVTAEPKVVGFLGDNTIVNFNDLAAQSLRNQTTFLPRSQQEILSYVTKPELITESWTQAASYLPIGRKADPATLPTATQCINSLSISQATVDEWTQFIANW